MPPILRRRLAVLVLLTLRGLLPAEARAADGDQDPTFGSGGLKGPQTGFFLRAAARLPNQDVAGAGVFDFVAPPVRWMRLSADGTLLFGCYGSVTGVTSFEGRAVVADRNGNVLVGGIATTLSSGTQEKALLVRFQPSPDQCGLLDSSWGDNGSVFYDTESFCDDEDCRLIDVVEAPTIPARTFALIESRVDATFSRYFVVALLANGHVNAFFGTNGYAEVTAFGLGPLSRIGAHLTTDAQGRPLVFGTRYNNSGELEPFLMRMTLLGALDTTFYSIGWRFFPHGTGEDDVGAAITVAPDGEIFVGINDQTTVDRVGWLCGGHNNEAWHCDSTITSRIAAVTLQGDGKVLVAADLTDKDFFTVRRLVRNTTGNGWTSDASFGSGGEAFYDVNLGGPNGQRLVAMVLSGGRPVIFGNADTDGADALFAIRLRNNYLFADGFEIGTPVPWSATE